MKPIIIIPTYNESENIEMLIRRLFELGITELEIIIVDDHSPDKTADIIKRLDDTFPIHLIERQKKLGIGSAYIAGFRRALELGADAILEMDADFSHNPNDVPRLLEGLRSADLIIGSRKIPDGGITGWGMVRTCMSNGAMWFARSVLSLKTKDVTAGFRCFSRSVLESIDFSNVKSNGYAFQEEVLYLAEAAGFRVMEIPVIFADRTHGKSKLSKKDIFEFFVVMLRLRFRKRE